jgi:nucleoside-diphosphate-sugar epimerase
MIKEQETVLITGANGFLGSAMVNTFVKDSHLRILAAVRNSGSEVVGSSEVVVGDINAETSWCEALDHVDIVVHCAARVHIMSNESAQQLDLFRIVNVEGTINLARQAASSGVKRFIYLSSIKVNGEGTTEGRAFTENDRPSPKDAYGVSKYEAEQELFKIARETGMEVVIIRPPLVYGPGVKGNFATMINVVAKGIPLPLGAVKNNRRSLLSLDNLVDFIITCMRHPNAANQTFMVSDGEDLSTSELLKQLSLAMGLPPRLIYVPVWILHLAAILFGKRSVAKRLCGSLRVDISKARDLLGWSPPISIDEGLKRAVTQRMVGRL